MSDLEHAKLMLAATQRDLKALRGMMDAVTFEDPIFGFHAQQMIAVLVGHADTHATERYTHIQAEAGRSWVESR